jgi:hypothetical protein
MLYYADSLLRRFEMPKFHLSPAPEPLRLRLTAKTIAVAAATTAATAAMFSDGNSGIVSTVAQYCRKKEREGVYFAAAAGERS